MKSYGRLSTDFYDLDKPAPPEAAIRFYRSAIGESTGPALEAMCGSGRFLVPLMELGVAVDGVDASTHMLNACRKRAEQRGLAPRLYEQFLDRLSLPTRYGLVFIPAGSIGLICEGDALARSLRRLHEHMLPGASLLIELVDKDRETGTQFQSGERRVESADGSAIRYAWTSRFVETTSVVEYSSVYELHSGGAIVEEEEEEIQLRLHSNAQFSSLLSEAGFVDVSVCDRLLNEQWLDEGGCVLFRARKPSAPSTDRSGA
jgi:hypothetical protein